MSEPTIDEMLAVLDEMMGPSSSKQLRALIAIRAILEQYREIEYPLVTEAVREHRNQLKVIRAFVERVERRAYLKHEDKLSRIYDAMHEELAALEKGNE